MKKKKFNYIKPIVLFGVLVVVALALIASITSLKDYSNSTFGHRATDTKAPESDSTPTPDNQKPTPTPGSEKTAEPTATATPTATPGPTETAAPDYSTKILDNNTVYTSEKYAEDIQKLAEHYSSVVSVDVIGKTVLEKDIYAVSLGNGNKYILATGGIHARENITVNYLMRIIEDYARAYCRKLKYFDYDVNTLLDKYTIVFVPCINVDGLDIVNGGEAPALTTKYNVYDLATWKANARGVDLNRNFPFMWDEMNAVNQTSQYNAPGKMNYPGESAGSEPETQAIMTLVSSKRFIYCLNFHTKGKVIYWRDAENGAIPEDEMIAKLIQKKLKFTLEKTTESVGSYGGGFENWFRRATGRNAFCIELTTGNDGDIPYNLEQMRKDYNRDIYDYYSAQVLDWENSRDLFLYLLKEYC